ncbi:unnamed protein product [Orchesella dallaii]|uniref:VWFA domain-containing protein n=1 Tax=Orchesella dallaii TaxID=48710 RepID=A0ABP1Q1B4_9HEXA
MFRTILSVLAITALIAIVGTFGDTLSLLEETGGVLTSRNGLLFIGSSKNLVFEDEIVRARSNIAPTTEGSLYFRSQNAASYELANSDCVSQLGPNSALVSIETQEELANITKILQESGDSSSVYWTSGRYDINDASFEWQNGIGLGPFIPWDANHPNSNTGLSRVALRNVGSIKFETHFNTVSHRYICELKYGQPGEEAEPCYTDNDLVIVVDSSDSIGQVNYITALDFAAKLIIAWVDNPNNRVSFVIYSNTAQSVIGLNESLTISQIRDRVYNAPYLAGGTASNQGINQAFNEFLSNVRAVPQNMVFLTNGVSNIPPDTLLAAQTVHTAGIRPFSVGIGSNINQEELLAIAGNNPDHVFNTDGFDELLKLLQPVSRRVCDVV